MNHLIQHFDANTSGRDFVVGDIHGCFRLLEALLHHVDFDQRADRVFSLGDLIDHGPESERVSEFLIQPWFHAIRGNHEGMLLRGAHTVEQAPVDMDATQTWLANAGSWFFQMALSDQATVYFDVSRLPILIEVAMSDGATAGLVHANVFKGDWQATCGLLPGVPPRVYDPAAAPHLDDVLWDRTRALAAASQSRPDVRAAPDRVAVTGIDLACFGHTPLEQALRLGNTRWLDTGAGKGGVLSIAELSPSGCVWSLAANGCDVAQGWLDPESPA